MSLEKSSGCAWRSSQFTERNLPATAMPRFSNAAFRRVTNQSAGLCTLTASVQLVPTGNEPEI